MDLHGGNNFTVGPLLIGPRIGLNASESRIDSYSEREDQVTGLSAIDGFTFVPTRTGATLVYDDQTIRSVQSRIGLVIALPFTYKNWTITTFAEGTSIHEFKNDQREIVVNFVEDERTNPLMFSFRNDQPERDYAEFAVGVSAVIGDHTEIRVVGKTVQGHYLYEVDSIELGLQLKF